MQAAVQTLNAELAAVPTDLYIGGKWRPATGGQRIEVIDPSTERVIASVADATVEDAAAAVDAAAAAAPAFARMPARQRGEILRKCFELMVRDKDKLARLISIENGKALADAQGEVAYAAEFFRWFSE
jgi:succinate-semialdehyde dehydrogenase/glutarate-semialdehyde dehydrogenase